MVTLRWLGLENFPVYQGPTGDWSIGDVREVAPVEAARLLRDFPGGFVGVEPPVITRPAKAPKRG